MTTVVKELPAPIEWVIERRMRPGRLSETGFLDNSERLVDVIDRDLELLAKVGVTPKQVADRLETIVEQAFRLVDLAGRSFTKDTRGSQPDRFTLLRRGVRIGPWELRGCSWRGEQVCPFVNAAGVVCNGESHSWWDFSLTNTRTRKSVAFPGLAIHLIREHGFFEGNVPHRVDPLVACEVLEIEKGADYSPRWSTECILENSRRSGIRSLLGALWGDKRAGLPIRRFTFRDYVRQEVGRLTDRLLNPFHPQVVDDETFGRLTYWDFSSIWFGKWRFPPSGTKVTIRLPGNRHGPLPAIRDLFEGLPDRFDSILNTVRPRLDEIFCRWLHRPLGESLWDELQLMWFVVVDPDAQPPEWDMVLELTVNEDDEDDEDDEFLIITVSLVGYSPRVAIVELGTS